MAGFTGELFGSSGFYEVSRVQVAEMFFSSSMSPDAPPTVVLTSPVDGTIARGGRVTLVANGAGSVELALALAWARFPDLSRPVEMIFDGEAFLSPYHTSTAVEGSLTLTVERVGGWPDDVVVYVVAVDEFGNYQYFSFPLTVPASGAAEVDASSTSAASVGRDLALDPLTWDIATPLSPHLTAGTEAVAQALKIQLSMIRGEYLFDDTVGLPYFESILVKRPDIIGIRQIYRDAALAVPGVLDVLRVELTIDPRTRVLSGTLTVSTDFGELAVPVETVV